jgi:hypothetical protein
MATFTEPEEAQPSLNVDLRGIADRPDRNFTYICHMDAIFPV